MPHEPKVLLVSSIAKSAMPLGLMSIATLLRREHKITTYIVDLPSSEGFDDLLDHLDFGHCRFVGLSTMCATLPRSLSLARAIKARAPRMPIVLGGPQASAAAPSLMKNYDFIDFILIGEAEAALGDLLSMVDGCDSSSPGILSRRDLANATGLDELHLQSCPLPDLQALPPIDYSTYRQAEFLGIEVGRGCPYNCTFCATSSFFQHRFRMRGTECILAQIRSLSAQHVGMRLHFVHDHFTSDRRLLTEICRHLVESKLSIEWTCSARADSIDNELIALMHEAGCREIYFGVETGSARMQKLLKKRLDLAEARENIRRAAQASIQVQVSFILGFPEESEQDVVDTCNLILELQAMRPMVHTIQLHMLAPLTGSEIVAKHGGNLCHDGPQTIASSLGDLSEWESAQIAAHPALFSSFFYVPNLRIPRHVYRLLHWMLGMSRLFGAFYSLLWKLFGDQSGQLLYRFAGNADERLMQGISISVDGPAAELAPELANVLRSFLGTITCADEIRQRLVAAIEFDIWRYSAFVSKGDPTGSSASNA